VLRIAAMTLVRHRLSRAALFLIAAASLFAAAPALAFTLDDVVTRAQALVGKPYVAPVSNLPPAFNQLQFGDYAQIQSKPQRFGWREFDTPFKLNFYHQGMQFNVPVKINEINGSSVEEIKYQADRFDFGTLKLDKSATSHLGYAGFRVLFPINEAGKEDEVMSFLGASYFRVIGKGQVYGLSGRALALDTTPPGGEEFPAFREFWIQRPQPQERDLVIFALLDSPRATGAYEFTLRPGTDAILDVRARVFLRDNVNLLGIAPLTSMFLFGPNQQADRRNFRPAIHDSNGLAIHTGSGEWLWRPLNNPQNLAVSTFTVENPRGFGLLQRAREFSRFEDLRDRYDLRPGAWIEPRGDWGKGKVELVEIPTPDETNDNIVAFWIPDAPAVKGQALSYDYRMHWTMGEPSLLDRETAWVKQTFHTAGEQLQSNLVRAPDGSTAFLVDFEGPVLADPAGTGAVTPQVSVSDNAELVSSAVERNPAIKGWRLTLRVKVKDPTKAVEMRAALLGAGNKVLSETWSYQLPPDTRPSR